MCFLQTEHLGANGARARDHAGPQINANGVITAAGHIAVLVAGGHCRRGIESVTGNVVDPIHCITVARAALQHARNAEGNVLLRGILGAAREAALAARCLLVTAEAQVPRLDAPMNAIVLPHWMISAVSIVPGGAYPSYAAGCYERDNRFYVAWDEIARDRDRFQQWMREYVFASRDHAQLLRRLRVAA